MYEYIIYQYNLSRNIVKKLQFGLQILKPREGA